MDQKEVNSLGSATPEKTLSFLHVNSFSVRVAVEGSGGSLAESGDMEFFSKGGEEEEGAGPSRTNGGLGRQIHRVITSHAEAAKIGG